MHRLLQANAWPSNGNLLPCSGTPSNTTMQHEVDVIMLCPTLCMQPRQSVCLLVTGSPPLCDPTLCDRVMCNCDTLLSVMAGATHTSHAFVSCT